jgi:multiple sugar transport system substrate-binding protein
VETRGIYYRTDLAAKAGFPDGPKTWDDLTAMAKAMQAKAGAKWGGTSDRSW